MRRSVVCPGHAQVNSRSFCTAMPTGPGEAKRAQVFSRQSRSSNSSPPPGHGDVLSLSLAVNAADLAVQRSSSPDGWTRELELQVAVCDPDFWNEQRELVERQLKFLTTDIWRVSFVGDGLLPAPPRRRTVATEDSVALLSGGMDSLVGALDLTGRDGLRPFAASQVAIGDKAHSSQLRP